MSVLVIDGNLIAPSNLYTFDTPLLWATYDENAPGLTTHLVNSPV